jgi:hypothetical protein
MWRSFRVFLASFTPSILGHKITGSTVLLLLLCLIVLLDLSSVELLQV